MTRRRSAAMLGCAVLAACVPSTRTAEPVSSPAVMASPAPAQQLPAGPAAFVYDGELEQGGWLRGQAPAGTREARLGTTPLILDAQGRFFAGFDRDAAAASVLSATLTDGRVVENRLGIRPRAWQIEHVNAALRPPGTNEDFSRRRAPELARIAAARSIRSDSQGWRQSFIWPATGRISGRFGAQRVYRGQPGSYHSGLDIAGGSGTPFVAPADGIVVLAADEEFTLEGRLLIIDHGQGLSSAFLHASTLTVHEGQRVRQGDPLGTIGATGRATGPHLHWGLVWQGARLDPLLFLPPRPEAAA
jgi:murein DD-endopeptidase MepM/ murein hydrolase activator NlpD